MVLTARLYGVALKCQQCQPQQRGLFFYGTYLYTPLLPLVAHELLFPDNWSLSVAIVHVYKLISWDYMDSRLLDDTPRLLIYNIELLDLWSWLAE